MYGLIFLVIMMMIINIEKDIEGLKVNKDFLLYMDVIYYKNYLENK